MKYCSNCGKANEDGSNFCANCGSKLEETMLIEEKNAPEQKDNLEETLLIEQKSASEQKDNNEKEGRFSWLKSLKISDISKNVKSIVAIALCLTCGFYAISGVVSVGEGIRSMANWVQDGFSHKEVNIVHLIIKEKRGIQEIAVAKGDYTVEKNITNTQRFGLFDYVTRKFICDFHYTVKYGYDLSTLTSSDITENKADKVVQIKLPKGMLISNELVKTNIRHNEGIFSEWNKVKAEDIDALQMEAKREVAQQAEADEKLNRLAKDNIKLAFEKTIRSVAPDYNVVVIGG